METIVKFDVRKMKEDIKVKVEEQKFYKKMRKDAKFIIKDGKPYWDPFHPSEAQWKHAAMRKTLRIMYAAYAVARNKSIALIDRDPAQIEDQAFKILLEYEIHVPVESQK